MDAAAPPGREGNRPPLDANQLALMARARQLGVAVEDLSADWGCDVVRYSHGGRSELVFSGQQFSSLSAHAAALCDHKHACKALLRDLGLRVPDGVFFHRPADVREAVEALLSKGPAVAKPVEGSHGDGVCLDLDRYEAVEGWWRSQRLNPSGYLVEAQVEGQDLRLQAVGGRLVAACRREPAHVVGDGERAVASLAAARDAVCRSQNPLNRLELDAHSLEVLRRQGLGPGDVPAKGRRVVLKGLSNISLGGLPVDVTDDLHPGWAEVVARIARALDARIFSVDVLSPDPTRGLADGWIIEVNGRPEWLHHTFSEVRRHDLPGLILADLFGAELLG